METPHTSQSSGQPQRLEITEKSVDSQPHSGSTEFAEKTPLESHPSGGSEGTTGESTSGDAGKDPENEPNEEVPSVPNSGVEPISKEKTVPKSIRLSQTAFDALKVLMGKYGKNMADMVSIAILAYAKNAAAAPILRSRLMDDKALFALQAAATDIRTGLSNLRNDLYEARKSHRNPEQLQAIYAELSAKYGALMKRADETLTLIDKESALNGLIAPCDRALLIQAVAKLKVAKPKSRTAAQLQELLIRIYNTLLR